MMMRVPGRVTGRRWPKGIGQISPLRGRGKRSNKATMKRLSREGPQAKEMRREGGALSWKAIA